MSKKRKEKNLLDNPDYISGTFRRNEKGFGFVSVEGEEEEIYISPKQTLNALNGDTVLIKVYDDIKHGKDSTSPKKEGKVVYIIKHEKDSLVGIFKKSKNFGFVIPDDKKASNDVYISKKNFGGAKNNQKVVVKITKYPDGNNKAEGKVVEILGKYDAAGVDILSLVKEYSLPYEFPEPVIKEAKSIPQEIKSVEQNRTDFRNDEIFTIDGEDAKDLDDAVSVQKNSDGTYNLNVHIADVSNYVKEGSKLDKEAITRGTSIYLMDRVIPMLPKELSNGICSLNEGKDRYALSAIMVIDQKGNVISSDVKKSIIKVIRRMNYNDVSSILRYVDCKKSGEEATKKDEEIAKKYSQYIEHFIRMRELKDILKARRERNGSLNLDIPESKIILDENGIAVDIKKYDYTEANEIIEQFMLTANETVAEKFYWLQAPFIYRVHEAPDIEKIDELNKFLFNLGYKIKGIKKDDKDSIHPKAFAQVLEEIKGKPEERVVSNLVLRTLKVARYEKENKGHFGIASKCYCHFTSPIRRYPDLFIHRVISDYIASNYNLKESVKEKYDVQSAKYADSSTEREKIAQKVERDAEDIKKAEYMQDKIEEEYTGIVSSITPFGMFVELENTVEGLIRFENMGNEYFAYDDQRKTLVGERTKRVFKIGNEVKIKVISADKQTRKIDFKLIEEKV